MSKFGVSQPVRRKEDQRFLTGAGRYLDDIKAKDAAHGVFLRSPVAHARIVSVDLEAARAAPGVVGAWSGADLDAKMKNQLNFAAVQNRDGSNGVSGRRPCIASDRVRYVGEAVALIVAETAAAARDAAELVEIDYDELPVVADTDRALLDGAETIHPEAPGNIAFDWAKGDEAATAAAFESAAHTVSIDIVDNKVISHSLETRSCMASWDGTDLRIKYGGQGPWAVQNEVAGILGLDKAHVHVSHPDIGGGFGTKSFIHPEYPAIAFAAKETGRTVIWIAERSEGALSDVMGRDHYTTCQAAFDADLKLTALRFDCVAGMGAYCSTFAQHIPSELALKVLTGAYDVQTVFFSCKGVFSNTTPIDAYRGAGRPEQIYALERLMDHAAREIGVDPIELRRKNFITTFPYTTASGELYDVGDFNRVLTRALKDADHAGFPARRAAARAEGKARGLGVCYYVESILGDQNESAHIEFAEDGGVNLYVGTQSTGQGHETVFAQFLHTRAGIPYDRIRMIQGDTDLVPKGGGTGGSRSVTMQGSAINAIADKMIEAFRPLAEDELEAAAADIVFEDGVFRVSGTDKTVDVMTLAARARREGQVELLNHRGLNTVPGRSFPNGCHIAEVEVDPDTGVMKVVRYTVTDDFGILMNPMLAEGQVHGGVVQGIGQAVTERVAYDDDGQPLMTSWMDYAMPRADDAPMISFSHEGTPSTANPIGMKGCGEAGTVGALAAVANAGLDALAQLGVDHVDMPMTPVRVWEWIQAAKTKKAA
ncbi:xanthine dehydrogenase family protein molybdopterin-binding subunit [Pikeienuella sp. HZG-20]|uniref:xanthine dehydrogenase family protein molybdopterin-binding subunit n=1 Tax=Paludibacillus litoralis TaxID=3133267 RepID=UPI0030EF2BAA